MGMVMDRLTVEALGQVVGVIGEEWYGGPVFLIREFGRRRRRCSPGAEASDGCSSGLGEPAVVEGRIEGR